LGTDGGVSLRSESARWHSSARLFDPVSTAARYCRRTESSDLLSVLDQLYPDTLSDSGVGLLGLNTDLLKDDALGVGRTTEWRGLVGGSEKALLVVEIGPSSLATMVAELAGGVETSRLSCGLL
jgi:hypothetical protein